MMAEFVATNSWPEARGTWRGHGGHLGKVGRQAGRQAGKQASKQASRVPGKLLEAVYEGKSVETRVREKMEECGRANGSWA